MIKIENKDSKLKFVRQIELDYLDYINVGIDKR